MKFLLALVPFLLFAANEPSNYAIEKQAKRLIIGLELRTNNQEGPVTIPAHWDRFYKENIIAKIPNRLGRDVFAIYTDYAGDYTQPYSLIIGCEVSSLEEIPVGLVAKVIPGSSYVIFTSLGKFPESLTQLWQKIWQLESSSKIKRAYSCDFEFYPADFDPKAKPAVKVYIAAKE